MTFRTSGQFSEKAMQDELGDRMKMYEGAEADRRLMPLLPVIARLDGKCFSRFTAGLARPFDTRMSMLMQLTTAHLVRNTGARCGYTQSDEITLAWYSSRVQSEIWFDGRIQKMCSVLASMASAYFNSRIEHDLPEKYQVPAHFDCRVWNVPTLEEGANTFLWRELDATKNSISMAARTVYSHQQLHGKGSADMQEMLMAKGINWNDYPSFFKRGVYLQTHKIKRKLTATELEELPPQHNARKNPDLEVERSELRALDMPKFSSVLNRAGVIFLGEDPQIPGADNGKSPDAVPAGIEAQAGQAGCKEAAQEPVACSP